MDDQADDLRGKPMGDGKIELCSERALDTKQIADAAYDPEAERLYGTFRDGTTAEVSTRP